jgi:hypothetical protein
MTTATGVPDTHPNENIIADTGEIYDIFRETAQGSNLLTRYCTNVKTQVHPFFTSFSNNLRR